MPFWNRHDAWKKSKASMQKQYGDYPIEFSICDDGSMVPLEEASWRLPHHTNALNPCVPINFAVKMARFDVIVLTNPETEHREPTLLKMLEALTDENDYVAAGCRDSMHGAVYAGPGRDYRGCLMPPGTHYHFCVMFHRSLWERAGGFDEDYRCGHGYEDNDWLWRLWALGDVNFKYVASEVWHMRAPFQRSLWKPDMLRKNERLLRHKWSHLPEFQACGS